METRELLKEYHEVVVPLIGSMKCTSCQYIEYRGFMSMNNVINSLKS